MLKIKRSIFIFLHLSFLCTLGLLSCTKESQLSKIENEDNVLNLLYWQSPTILNPHLSAGVKDLEASRISLEPLASYDKNGKMVLFLAAEVPSRSNGGIAADGKSVIWKLKPEIKWSDGNPLTAADVVFTYSLISNPKVGSISASVYEKIESVEALDKLTVKINFKEVNPNWSHPFVGSSGMILPKHIFEKYNGSTIREAAGNLMPVGTGPYRVVEFKPGDTVIYEPNPYFRDFRQSKKLPEFQKIMLSGGVDSTSAAKAVLQTGEADFAYNLQVEPKVLEQLEAGSKGNVLTSLDSGVERIMPNFFAPNSNQPTGENYRIQSPHPFLTDKKVRQALNKAIDRDTIARELYGVSGIATTNFLVLPSRFQSSNTSYEFNLEQAAILLDEADWVDTNGNGIRDKNGVEMKLLYQTSINSIREKTQLIVKQAWESLGVEVELKTIDPSIFFSDDPTNSDTIVRFAADLQMFNIGNDNPDPGTYLKMNTCEEIPQKANNWTGSNFSGYCNKNYDILWQKSASELNPLKRQQFFVQMNDLLIDDVAVMPIVHRANMVGVSNSLSGIDLTPWDSNTWNIMNWKRSQLESVAK